MFCKNCGNPLNEGVRFCSYCGSEINAPATPAPVAPEAPVQPIQQAESFQPVEVVSPFAPAAPARHSAAPETRTVPMSDYFAMDTFAAPAEPAPAKGKSVASLVLGILSLSLALCLIPSSSLSWAMSLALTGWTGGIGTLIAAGIFSVAVIILGAIGRKKYKRAIAGGKKPTGVTKVGGVLSKIGLILGIVLTALFFLFAIIGFIIAVIGITDFPEPEFGELFSFDFEPYNFTALAQTLFR